MKKLSKYINIYTVCGIYGLWSLFGGLFLYFYWKKPLFDISESTGLIISLVISAFVVVSSIIHAFRYYKKDKRKAFLPLQLWLIPLLMFTIIAYTIMYIEHIKLRRVLDKVVVY